MNIYLNIEKLIAYASVHLLLDEADEIYVRNALLQKLGISEYEVYEADEDEIESMENPLSILDVLFDYALEKGLVKAEERRLFCAEIMDIVSLRPGEMEDMFDSVGKNSAKALDWAYDYAVKSYATINRFNRWENKGDKNIEVIFDECNCGKSRRCCKCLDCEGYGVHKNDRFLQLPIGGDWYFRAAKHSYFEGMGHIVSRDHKPLVLDKSALDVMFDFIEYAPARYITTCEGEDTAEHAYYICSARPFPVMKAGDKAKFKSKEYPYISVAQTDWYVSTLRLACTNREKLTEFALKLIEIFKKEYDCKVAVSLFRNESKFVILLSFIGKEVKKCGLCGSDLLAYCGIFKIGSKVEGQLKTIEKYLTKELRFSPMCLVDGMEAHEKIINTLLKEVGASKLGAVEAALDVKEECKKTLVSFLHELSAFEDATKLLEEHEINFVK